MKLSILTATYNRGELLKKLYKSIVDNMCDELDIEWLIMDDGSTDNTEEIVEEFRTDCKKINKRLEIKYYKQENQGKMKALNNLMQHVTGELVMDCDSDDYFIEGAFEKINHHSSELLQDDELYALVFLKNGNNENVRGKIFENTSTKTTMFDMYFKENMDGEKILIFKTRIRKMYKHELECNEKFVTEARLYYKIEEKYKVKCYNEEIVFGDYLEDGYTNNTLKLFMKNPNGFFQYFKEILERDTKGVTWRKRLYVIKHYILFQTLAKRSKTKIKSFLDNLLYYILVLPGKIIVKIKY